MTQKRKRYDRQFKIAAAQVVLSGDMTVKEPSEELRTKDSTLRRWAQEYESMGDSAFPGNGISERNGSIGEAPQGQAVGRENPPNDYSLVFHDDQGSQHASRAFQRCLESHGIAQSMSRPGNPWENAIAESFFKTLKRELIKERPYRTREDARQEVFKYIELYCNTQRMHSSLGYRAPCDLERGVA